MNIFSRYFSSATKEQQSLIDLSNNNLQQSHEMSHQEDQSILTDTFKRKHDYLRISLIEKCNFRCQVNRIIDIFTQVGVNKIRLTGGEPLVRKDLIDIVHDIKSRPQIKTIAMTTNASLLPRKIERLREAGLNQINISLDTLVEAKNQFITRRHGGFQQTLKAIDMALNLDFEAVKLNVVAMKGFNEDELCDFVEFVKDRAMEVRFIEFMPFDQNDWNNKKLLPYFQIRKLIEDKYKLTRNQDGPHATSKTFSIEGYKGTVGFISSMSEHFCGGCNRMRITADGNLKICLFDNREINLREMIDQGMSDSDILLQVREHLYKKHFSHGGVDSILQRENRSMTRIGG
eukprot:403330934